jgi:hypothetical protein
VSIPSYFHIFAERNDYIIAVTLLEPYNSHMLLAELAERKTPHAHVKEISGGWRLELDEGNAGSYRLAQLDNYARLSRRAFPHVSPLKMKLQARASHKELPGTWGFGVWNDPFGFSLGFGGSQGRLPALPNAAWFFFASEQNHVSFRNELPGHGTLAATFSSPRIPTIALAPAILALPLLAFSPTSRWLRRQASKVVRQDALSLKLDATIWHEYELTWQKNFVQFSVDAQPVLNTKITPRSPLALVLWLDNQYAAWRPNGRLGYGAQATPPDCWVEIKDLRLN